MRSHHETREEPYRLGVGLIGAEAMLRLFAEPEANARAFDGADALPRPRSTTLAAAAERRPGARSARALVPAQAAVALGLPAARHELRRVRRRRRPRRLLAARGRRGLRAHADGSFALSPEGLAGIERLLSTPLADAAAAGSSERARREALAVVTSSYEEHGGFRLRTLSA